MVYDLPLVEEKVKPHQITALHLLCALAFAGTGAIIFVYNYTIPMWGLALLIAGLLLLTVTIARNKWIVRPKINPAMRIVELLVAIAIAVLSVVNHWKFPAGIFGVLSAALVFALYWERQSGNALSIHIDDTGIRLPITARKRALLWTEVEQVVYKYDILTINCADNRLMQWNITDNNTNPTQLEDYCNNKVEENRSKRIVDDW